MQPATLCLATAGRDAHPSELHEVSASADSHLFESMIGTSFAFLNILLELPSGTGATSIVPPSLKGATYPPQKGS